MNKGAGPFIPALLTIFSLAACDGRDPIHNQEFCEWDNEEKEYNLYLIPPGGTTLWRAATVDLSALASSSIFDNTQLEGYYTPHEQVKWLEPEQIKINTPNQTCLFYSHGVWFSLPIEQVDPIIVHRLEHDR